MEEKTKDVKPKEAAPKKKEPVKEAKKPVKPVAKPVIKTIVSKPMSAEPKKHIEKIGVNKVPFEVWFSLRGKKHTYFKPMRVFAQKRSPLMLQTLAEWDELFKRF